GRAADVAGGVDGFVGGWGDHVVAVGAVGEFAEFAAGGAVAGLGDAVFGGVDLGDVVVGAALGFAPISAGWSGGGGFGGGANAPGLGFGFDRVAVIVSDHWGSPGCWPSSRSSQRPVSNSSRFPVLI